MSSFYKNINNKNIILYSSYQDTDPSGTETVQKIVEYSPTKVVILTRPKYPFFQKRLQIQP